MQKTTDFTFRNLNFVYLPPFAEYLLTNKLREFCEQMLETFKAVQLPLLKLFDGKTNEELLQISIQTTHEFLRYLAANKAEEQITESLQQWLTNSLPGIERNKIEAEDITLVNYGRKQAFLYFIPDYCTDQHTMLQLIKEIDWFVQQSEAASTNTYISLLRNRVHEAFYFNEQIANTSPGIIYLFNLKTFTLQFINKKAEDFFGYTSAEMNRMSSELLSTLIHPDDLQHTITFLFSFNRNTAKSSATLEFRLKKGGTDYVWMRNYASVFRYNERGNGVQVIGIIQDINIEKNAQVELQQSRQQLLEAQEMAGVGSFEWDMVSNNTQITPHLLKIFDLESSTEYKNFLQRVHPADKQKVEKAIKSAIDTKGIYECEYRYMGHQKEKIVWARGVIITENDKPLKMRGTVMDITERSKILDELKYSQELYKQAEALSHIGSYSLDIDTNIVQLSDELIKIYELRPNHKSYNFKDLVAFRHPDDDDMVTKKLQDAIRYRKSFELYYRIITKGGKVKTLHTHGKILRNEQNNPVTILGTAQDATERLRTEEQLKENQNFIQKIADASPTILYLFDVKTNSIIYINREVFYMLGYSVEEIMQAGDNATQLLYHPEDFALLPERKESEKKFQHRDSMVQYECRMKEKEGNWKWFVVREVVFKWDDDGITQILGAALDISKRKEMEKSVLQNAFQLEQSNASLEEFAYVASHDLKEPLRKISTFGDRLLTTQADKLTTDGKIYLNKIVDASQRMQLMINDLLSIAMISGDQSFQPHSLQSILEDVRQTLEYKIEQKNAFIEADVLPEATIVPSLFRQLFQNIISNSLKFAREDTLPVITIKYQFLEAAEVEKLSITKADRYLKLEFRDNGIGFEEEYAGKIFAIFQRLHGRSEYEGTGIGLAICKKIVEHHRGIIYAAGIPDQGATFTIILPQ